MWYHTIEKSFLYQGDLDLLGIKEDQELPNEIVPLKWIDKPVSNDIHIDYVMVDPVLKNGFYEVTWSEVVYTDEEIAEMQKTQEELSEKTIQYLLNRVW